LSYVEGAVSVNRGSGFVPASPGAFLTSGDRVRVKTGSADITYENGCVAKIGADQIAVVLSTPPSCAGALTQQTAVSTETLVRSTDDPASPRLVIPDGAGTFDAVGIGIGAGLFAGGIGVGAILANSGGGSTSFSP